MRAVALATSSQRCHDRPHVEAVLIELLACPDCRCSLRGDADAFDCACGASYPVAAGIPRLLPRALREQLGPLGDRAPRVAEGDHSQLNVALANVSYHATEPEAYGDEALASIGMFTEGGNAQRRLDEVVRFMAQHGAGDVLIDAGCGPGNVLGHAARAFRRPVGVDLCIPMLERARRSGFEVVAGDAYRLPFADGVADAITAFSFLHHLSDWRAFVREAVRVLKPGGWFYSDWDPNGRTRDRSAAFKLGRDALVKVLDRIGVVKAPRYYRPDVRGVAELAEFGWHFGDPLDGRAIADELQTLGVAAPRLIFHDDCPTIDRPQSATAWKRIQRAATLALAGQIDLALQGADARAEYFLLLGCKSR